MDIKRLTITPIMKGLKGFTINNPSVDSAQLLIKERLLTHYGYTTISKCPKKIHHKIPNWVNMKMHVD